MREIIQGQTLFKDFVKRQDQNMTLTRYDSDFVTRIIKHTIKNLRENRSIQGTLDSLYKDTKTRAKRT